MTIIKEGEHKRNERDFYPTPEAFCIPAIRACQPWIERDQKPIRVLDAGAGGGVWGKAVKNLNPLAILFGIDLHGVEPVTGYDVWYEDFFEVWAAEYTGEKFDLVIGNPPYGGDAPEKWLRLIWHRLLKPQGRVFWLLRLAFYSSQGRYDRLWSKGYHPVYIYQSAARLSFTGDGKTDDTDYAMFLWMREWDKDFGHVRSFNYKRDPVADSGQLAMFEGGDTGE